MASVKQVKLKSNEEEYSIFAITANLRDFQFCDFINTVFSIEIRAQEPIEISLPDGKTVKPFLYSSYDDSRKTKITIVDSKSNGIPFIDFLKNITYFLKISPALEATELTEIQQRLSENEKILFVQRIDIQSLASKQKNILKALFLNI